MQSAGYLIYGKYVIRFKVYDQHCITVSFQQELNSQS